MTTEQLIQWVEGRLARATAARRAAPVGSVAWTEASATIRRLEADLIEFRRLLVEAERGDGYGPREDGPDEVGVAVGPGLEGQPANGPSAASTSAASH